MSHFTRNSILQHGFNCVAALMLFTGLISAQTTQTKTENFTSYVSFQSLTSSGDFMLPSFDTSLGNLENMTLTFAVNSSALQLVYNSNGKPVGFQNFVTPLSGSVFGPGQLVLNAVAPTPVSDSTTTRPGCPTGSSNNFLATPSSVHLGTSTATSNQTTLDVTDPNVLALWEGQGTSPVDLSYFADGSGSSIPNTGVFPSTFNGTCKVTVAYTYDITPVATPEPPGKYLTAIVAAGMTLMLIRRRNRFHA